MNMLIPAEKSFLDVLLHEVTTVPFHGPATRALHGIGVEYQDISFLAWAYEQEVPRPSHEWGYAADVSPLLPWTTKEEVLLRNAEVKRHWELQQQHAISHNTDLNPELSSAI